MLILTIYDVGVPGVQGGVVPSIQPVLHPRDNFWSGVIGVCERRQDSCHKSSQAPRPSALPAGYE